jgi:hypothetical protein
VYVLGQMVEAVKLGGLVLDLQVIRPNPIVEADRNFVCEIDGEPLFRTADAATAAIDALVDSGRLLEQATDDHDVRGHYTNGADLIDAYTDKRRQLSADALPALRAHARPCVVRERCRLRRLQVR